MRWHNHRSMMSVRYDIKYNVRLDTPDLVQGRDNSNQITELRRSVGLKP